MSQDVEKTSGYPTSSFQLFFMLIKSFIKNFLVSLVIGVFVFLAVLVIHTYLIVKVNDGFWAGQSNLLNNILSLKEKGLKGISLAARNINGTLFWILVSAMVFGTISRIVKFGIFQFLADVSKQVFSVLSNIVSFRKPALSLFLSGLFIALALAMILNSYTVCLLLAIFIFLSVSAQERSFMLLILRLAKSDFGTLFRLKNSGEFNLGNAAAFFNGMWIGLAGSVFIVQLVGSAFLRVLILAAVLALIIFNSYGGKKAVAGIFVITSACIIVSAFQGTVFADDGGWKEAGGTLNKWWQSQGRDIAINMGITPAIWSAILSMFGWVIPSCMHDLFPVAETPVSQPPVTPGVIPGPALTPPEFHPMYGVIIGPGSKPPGLVPMYGVPAGPLRPPQIQPLYGITPGEMDSIKPMYGIMPGEGIMHPDTIPSIKPLYGVPVSDHSAIKPLYGIPRGPATGNPG